MGSVEPIRLADEAPFAIGTAKVVPAARSIINDGIAIELEPRAMQVLVALAAVEGDVVGRQTLVDRCWEGRIVGDDAINRAIQKLRRQFAVAGLSATIETVPRIGYRLNAPNGRDAVFAPRDRVPSRRLLLVGAGATALIGTAGFGLLRKTEHKPDTALAMPSRARELFERGEVAFQQGSRDDNAQAVGFFEQAAAIAPHNAQIIGALALAYRFEQTFRGPALLEQSTRRADLTTDRALRLDPRNPDAVAARSLHLPFGNQWIEVERGLRAGLRDVPDSGVMNGFLGMLLTNVGRMHEAVAAFEQSIPHARFVPLLRGFMIQALFAVGRVSDVDRELDAAIALWPRFAMIWWLRFWTYALTGRFDDARMHAKLSPALPLEIGRAQIDAAQLAIAALTTRTDAAAREALASWDAVAAADPALRTAPIGLASSLGRIDDALARAETVLRPFVAGTGAGAPSVTFLFAAPMAATRKHARFWELCDRIGLVDYWRQTRSHPDDEIPELIPV